MQEKICKNCRFYEEAFWHPCLDSNQERKTQHAGFCEALIKFLAKDNPNLIYINLKNLYVFENFTCGLCYLKQ